MPRPPPTSGGESQKITYPNGAVISTPQSSPLLRRHRRGAGSLSCVGADGQQADVIDGQAGMEDPGALVTDVTNRIGTERSREDQRLSVKPSLSQVSGIDRKSTRLKSSHL